MTPETRRYRSRLAGGSLMLLLLALVAAFMTLGATGNWSFILSYRGEKLVTVFLVAWAVPLSTILFHAISDNRILTPSIMGFDALFVLIQTFLIFFIGSARIGLWPEQGVFLAELAIMVAFAMTLYGLLFRRVANSLELLLLVGIVLGVLFRSISGLLQRLIDPGEFLVLQGRIFASFSGVQPEVRNMAATCIGLTTLWAFWRLPAIDVMVLGRGGALSVGLPHRRLSLEVFAMVTVLVAASTALVGPITFFGLLIAHVTYRLLPGAPLRQTILIAGLLGALLLVGGQVVLERVLGFDGSVGMVVEFLGGLLFILLLIERTR
ncbi:iron chelate uptake ABC transporter family permease subunit [Paracoccus seriniphilus]|uniref:Iron complex transport system permease protein n=1 Tax=Paracoccus seriniphilus TaxID=184748 RepID=A0A239PPH0_9RHOB|nr:iron chelate uptake ABC transporter family permease subunit [Paracoccus seriniphilus]WCR14800.1 iron chelate uptake ABC transporter family permease subunit [Paracoccus seriniphilus]SNT71786.1 iron complex transport system permease protein [Paracoccus seriniphilus]